MPKYLEVLVDLKFNGSQNKFEEIYNDSVTYQELEQDCYIDFKNMVNDYIGKVKFRKAREISQENSLTCRLFMTPGQYKKFEAIYKGQEVDKKNSTAENIVYYKFRFLHDFKICNLRLDEDETEK
jgi:hypothetical protein